MADPALNPSGLARLVQAAVIHDVPAQLIVAFPAFGPELADQGNITVGAGHHATRSVGKVDSGDAVVVGYAGSATDHLDGCSVDRLPCCQVGDPGNRLLIVGDGVESKFGALHPDGEWFVAPVVCFPS